MFPFDGVIMYWRSTLEASFHLIFLYPLAWAKSHRISYSLSNAGKSNYVSSSGCNDYHFPFSVNVSSRNLVLDQSTSSHYFINRFLLMPSFTRYLPKDCFDCPFELSSSDDACAQTSLWVTMSVNKPQYHTWIWTFTDDTFVASFYHAVSDNRHVSNQ